MSEHRLARTCRTLVGIARIANLAIGLCGLVALLASLAGLPLLEARLAAKYGGTANLPAILCLIRLLLAGGLIAVVAAERLLRALGGILRSVQQGEPFAAANGGRLRTIGWMLLCLQLLDLGAGLATLVAHRLQVEVAAWQPSFTGWFAVLVAFVLVRVFATGGALQADLEGTV